MGERKVLNKYYPPDFDPAKLPRNRRGQTNEMKVRMMLPMSVRCKTCGNFMYKGTKFNTRKEDVVGENYLGIQVFRFYYRCTNCAAEFTMKTDPKNMDYLVEHGASRNYEPWREQEVVKEEFKKKREEEEMGNAMKALENRTLDSKREMDIMAALDEMRSLGARHEQVTLEQALEALVKTAQEENPQEELDEEDVHALKAFLKQKQEYVQRLEDGPDAEEEEEEEEEEGRGRLGMSVSAVAGTSGRGSQVGAPQLKGAAGPPVVGTGEGERRPDAVGRHGPLGLNIIVRPKRPVVEGAKEQGGEKKLKARPIEGEHAVADDGREGEPSSDEGGGLAGLGGYGSSDSQEE